MPSRDPFGSRSRAARDPGKHGGAGLRVVPYQPGWPRAHALEATRLLAVKGLWVTRAEHIGSTAVVGLQAKPIIDIMLGAPDLDGATRHCVAPLEDLGYVYVRAYDEAMPDQRFFLRDAPGGERTHHVHMVRPDGVFWADHLLFRDYLRAHPDATRAYGKLKAALAPRFTDANAYGATKAAFISDCMRAARA